MTRVLYTNLKPEEVENKEYPDDKLIHWEIRLYFKPQSYISVYWFKGGIPFDKEPINGLAMYGYEVDDTILNKCIDYLHTKFQGSILRRSYRVFFENCKIIRNNKEIAELAYELRKKFECISEIWLEFDSIEEDLVKKLFKRPLIIGK